MARAKTILTKILLCVLAFQILNTSIDSDYALSDLRKISANFDDVDSYTELIVETIVGDENFTTENDNDSGDSDNKTPAKSVKTTLYSQSKEKITFDKLVFTEAQWETGLDQANRLCQGYLTNTTPPPKA